uniref:hypothetical protein n=1 Tax=Orrella sp. TaxID=1921583 RepID=UPI0040559A4E
MSGVEVAKIIKSMSLADFPACANARLAASQAKSLVISPAAARCRWRMPVLETIHSSDVSTPLRANSTANASLVNTRVGK